MYQAPMRGLLTLGSCISLHVTLIVPMILVFVAGVSVPLKGFPFNPVEPDNPSTFHVTYSSLAIIMVGRLPSL